MTAERPGGDGATFPGREAVPEHPVNPGHPAVTLCPGSYTKDARMVGGFIYADCDVCGVTGLCNAPCQQTVIS